MALKQRIMLQLIQKSYTVVFHVLEILEQSRGMFFETWKDRNRKNLQVIEHRLIEQPDASFTLLATLLSINFNSDWQLHLQLATPLPY